MEPVKVITYNENFIYNEGLRMILEEDKHVKLVAKVSSLEELKGILANERADIAIFDVKVSDPDFFKSIKKIKKLSPGIKFLGLCPDNSEKTIVKAVESGVDGLLYRDTPVQEFYFAICQITEQEYYFNQSILDKVYKSFINSLGKQ